MRDRVISRPLEILLVEDNPADVRLTEYALEEAEFHVNLTVVETGEEAISLLSEKTEADQQFRPDLILLDLALPGITGHEFLEQIRSDENTVAIPVVMLTASTLGEHVKSSFALHANGYIAKPVQVDEFNKKVRDTLNYWVSISIIPTTFATGSRPTA